MTRAGPNRMKMTISPRRLYENRKGRIEYAQLKKIIARNTHKMNMLFNIMVRSRLAKNEISANDAASFR